MKTELKEIILLAFGLTGLNLLIREFSFLAPGASPLEAQPQLSRAYKECKTHYHETFQKNVRSPGLSPASHGISLSYDTLTPNPFAAANLATKMVHAGAQSVSQYQQDDI